MNKLGPLQPTPTIPGSIPGMPVGSVIAFAGEIRTKSSDPHETNLFMFDWLLCDGSEVLIAQYPELYQALGNRYGGSDGKFKLPDYRGTFLRGVGNDEGSMEKRKAFKQGEESKVGSTQDYALLSHTHEYQKTSKGAPIPAENAGTLSASPLIPTQTKEPNIDSKYLSSKEIRPVNTFVYWLIKARLD